MELGGWFHHSSHKKKTPPNQKTETKIVTPPLLFLKKLNSEGCTEIKSKILINI